LFSFRALIAKDAFCLSFALRDFAIGFCVCGGQLKQYSLRPLLCIQFVIGMSSWDAWWQRDQKPDIEWRADDPAQSDRGMWRRDTSSASARWDSHPDSGWSQSWQGSDSAHAATSTAGSWTHVQAYAGGGQTASQGTIAVNNAATLQKEDPWTIADPWSIASSASAAGSLQ
jgi:hypothetical protein